MCWRAIRPGSEDKECGQRPGPYAESVRLSSGVRGGSDPEGFGAGHARRISKQAIEKSERDCWHHKQVHRSNAIRVIAQERLPPLGRRSPPSRHVLGHTRLSDIIAEPEQPAMDTLPQAKARAKRAHAAARAGDNRSAATYDGWMADTLSAAAGQNDEVATVMFARLAFALEVMCDKKSWSSSIVAGLTAPRRARLSARV